MLRFDHMRSDFHPLFLFLGEAADIAALADMMRAFSNDAREMSVLERIRDAKSRADVILMPADDGFGMRETDGRFRWRLNAWQASQIAARLDELTRPDHRSGSDIFEVGSEGEIPVKVSRGEFTDDFLVSKR